jgi:hypothetical protein
MSQHASVRVARLRVSLLVLVVFAAGPVHATPPVHVLRLGDTGLQLALPAAAIVQRDGTTFVLSVPEQGFVARISTTRADAPAFLANEVPQIVPGFKPVRTESPIIAGATCTHWLASTEAVLHCRHGSGPAMVASATNIAASNSRYWQEIWLGLSVPPNDPPAKAAKALPVQPFPVAAGRRFAVGAAHGNDILAAEEAIRSKSDPSLLSSRARLVLSRDGGRTFKVVAPHDDDFIESIAHDGADFWVRLGRPDRLIRVVPGRPPVPAGTPPADFKHLVDAGPGVLLLKHGFQRDGLRFALSRDQGASWHRFAGPVRQREREFDQPTFLIHSDGLFYCSSGGVFISTDLGVSWRERAKVPCGQLQVVGDRVVVAGEDGAWVIDGDKATRLASVPFIAFGRMPGGLVAVPQQPRMGLEMLSGPMRALAFITPAGVSTQTLEGAVSLPRLADVVLTEADYIASGLKPETARELAKEGAENTGFPAFPDFVAVAPGAILTFISGGITRIPLVSLPMPGRRAWRLPSAPYVLTMPTDFEASIVNGMLVTESIVRRWRITWHAANDTSAEFDNIAEKLLSTKNCGRFDVGEARREIGTGQSQSLLRAGTCVSGLGYSKSNIFIVRMPTPHAALYAMVITDDGLKVDPGQFLADTAGTLAPAVSAGSDLPTLPAWKPLPALKTATALAQTSAALLALTPKGLLRSSNGVDFTPTALPGGAMPVGVHVFDSNVFANTATGDIFKSHDHGATWTLLGAMFDGATLVGAHDLGPVLALAVNDGVDLMLAVDPATAAPTTPTRDSGWTPLQTAVPGTRVDYFHGNGGAFVVQTDRGAFASSNTGETWAPWGANTIFAGV